ncbi:MAG: hypothetical protein RI925_684, partial [Pseudomonadota bacterium]
MSVFFEIAYAAANKRLCFFLGAGFSKELTQGHAPSWDMLLKQLCDLLKDSEKTKEDLFSGSKKGQLLTFEEIGQILALEFKRQKMNLHEEAARLISRLTLKGDNRLVKNFLCRHSPHVITTNYDLLIEKLLGDEAVSISPGLPVPRISGKTKIYHVHGSINAPAHIVITSDDYFKFISNEGYFSRKLSTMLHENTVVIMGYSMGDVNLKAIINEHRRLSIGHNPGGNIFFVSRASVNQQIKNYYFECYGVTVVDDVDVKGFFRKTNKHIKRVEEFISTSIQDIDNVLVLGHEFVDDFIWIESSFYIIISAIHCTTHRFNEEKTLNAISDILCKKIGLASMPYGSWHHCAHLSGWIIRLGEMMRIKGSLLEGVFLEAADLTMSNMSKENKIGFSWKAYHEWSNGWGRLL